jgi:hypothetical protein
VRIAGASGPGTTTSIAPATGWSAQGRISDSRLPEISGVVASRRHPGTFWVHNDSGDGPRVFAIGLDGAVRGEVQVDGARAVDWEDIAIGPGPAGTRGDWVYVADTGNNFFLRRELSLYRFAEPSSITDGRVGAERLGVRFDDHLTHNVEAVFVDPRSGDTLLVTKTNDAQAKLFRVAARPFDGSTAVAQQVGLLKLGAKVTGADISPDGSRIAVRTYGQVSMWRRGAGDTIAQALARTPQRVLAAPSGEAVAFSADGGSWVSIGEGVGATVYSRPLPNDG